MKRLPLPRTLIVALAAIAGLVLVTLGLLGGALVWTDYVWYESVGRQSVLLTRIVLQAGFWTAGSLISLAVLLPALAAADRVAHLPARTSRIARLGALVIAIANGRALSVDWDTLTLALNHSAFNLKEPQTGLDVGFFVFTLPGLEVVSRWITGLLLLAALLALMAILFAGFSAVVDSKATRWRRLAPLAATLCGLTLLASALEFRLAIWRLELSPGNQLFGADYTDVHARIPALAIMTALTAVLALVFLWAARSRGWRAVGVSIGAWTLTGLLVMSAWPTAVEYFEVRPNEATAEAPYIGRMLAATNEAFGLTQAKTAEYRAQESSSSAAAEDLCEALADVRIWTPKAAENAFSQLQTIRPYYRLSPIENDRYTISGRSQGVLVSARQIDTTRLPASARTWVNEHLVYTHGYGVTIARDNGVTAEGLPEFVVGGVPPAVPEPLAGDSPALRVTEPRIYFGPGSTGYAFVNAAIDEFDYPKGAKNVTYRHDASDGVRLGSGLRRLALAIRLRSMNVLLSDYLTGETRVFMKRDVQERASTLAPWLSFKSPPYPAVVDGRVLWILEGFTTSDHFPYSQPLGDGTNYLRDSVKVTVDAYSGDIRFYASGDDPIRDSWARVHPGLITPEVDTPAQLAAHFRYPVQLFGAQMSAYRTTHMTDPSVYYDKEDPWQDARTGDAPLDPAYLMYEPDGPAERSLYLAQAFVPPDSDNLVSWVAGTTDERGEPQLLALQLPKDRVTLGPSQVFARINQDPEISPRLSLWNQRGSKVVFGEMTLLPAGNAVAYVQPVFLKAKDHAVTQLVGVIVVCGDHIEMSPSMSAAIERLRAPSAAS